MNIKSLTTKETWGNYSVMTVLKIFLTCCLQSAKSKGIKISLNCDIKNIIKDDDESFVVDASSGQYRAVSLVIASGGLSIPKMCASPLGYKVAEQFGHHIWPTSPARVPFHTATS